MHSGLLFLQFTSLFLVFIIHSTNGQGDRATIQQWCKGKANDWEKCQEKLAKWCKKQPRRLNRHYMCTTLRRINPEILSDDRPTTTPRPRPCNNSRRRRGLCGNEDITTDATTEVADTSDTGNPRAAAAKGRDNGGQNDKGGRDQKKAERRAGKVEKAKLRGMRERMSRLTFKRVQNADRSNRRQLRKLQKRNPNAKRQISEQTINNPDDYWEGDVDLSPEQAQDIEDKIDAQLQSEGVRTKRKVGEQPVYKHWTDMPISFQFGNIPESTKGKIRQAVKLWEENTCVRFQEDGPKTDRLEFYNGPGCSSYVGRVGGTQEVSIHTPGCDWVGIISHEIGHALGFFHEQARPDRDKYVSINLGNVDFWYQNNFALAPTSDVDFHGQPYDYGSVMHYDPYAFAVRTDEPTIQPVDAGYEATMGQRAGPSFIDFAQVNDAYCASTCANKLNCENGGYTDPNDCSVCKCPAGLGGSRCETVDFSTCGSELQAYRAQDADYISSPNYPNKFSADQYCAWYIKAAPGAKVVLEFVDDFAFDCKDVCDQNYVEVKYISDKRRTGTRHCCSDRPDRIESEDNEMIVMFRSEATTKTGFRAKYYSNDGRQRPGGPVVTVRPTQPPTRATTTVARATTTERPWWITTRAGQGGGGGGQTIDQNGCTCQQWSEWTACTQQCGGCGKQQRARTCDKSDCYDKGEKRCGFTPCAAGQNFLWNAGEFHILLQQCCIGMFQNQKGECGGLSSTFSELFSSLVPSLDRIKIQIPNNGR